MPDFWLLILLIAVKTADRPSFRLMERPNSKRPIQCRDIPRTVSPIRVARFPPPRGHLPGTACGHVTIPRGHP
jgi:hypothetical protein